MKDRRLMSTVQTVDWSWNCSSDGEWSRQSSTRGHIWLDESGRMMHRMMRPVRPAPRSLPLFAREVRRWRRFLSRYPVKHFELGCKRRRIQGIGRMSASFMDREWRIGLDRDTHGLGRLLFSWTVPGTLPPDRFLMDHLRLLVSVPQVRAVYSLTEPVVFRGDLLVHLLAGGLERACQRLGALGQWNHTRPQQVGQLSGVTPASGQPMSNGASAAIQGPSSLRSSPEQPSDDGDRVESHFRPLVPVRRRFLPDSFAVFPHDAWRAVMYRGDDQVLICHHPRRGFATFSLNQPLRRVVSQLVFQPSYRTIAVKGVTYELPDGCYLP